MRKLWEDHITWTRLYIVSAATLPDDLPDIGPTAERLFANQDDIGAAVGSFYGQAAGNQLTALLHEHIALAAQAITAAKAGDDAGLQQALDDWYANADDIARFLADANPRSWPFDEMRAHMRAHLDLTLEEAVARLHGDYAADIAAYDKVHTQILEMADMLANGIIDAFPARFGR
jgi:prophage DNA circulation protein